MKYFYVIYIKDELLKNFLNAIRLIGNPLEKHDSHITVRGPYSEPIDKRIYDSIIENEIIRITSIDTFFSKSQNTVFLRCDSDKLREIWSKPDYDYNPHITLYDGKSRVFAERLLRILNSHLRNFKFKADKLYELKSVKGKINEPITVNTTVSYIYRIVGEKLRKENLEKLDVSERLFLIELLTEDLAHYRSNNRINVELSDYDSQKFNKSEVVSENLELFPDYKSSRLSSSSKFATLKKSSDKLSK